MSSRRKREVAPPPHTVTSSPYPPGVPTPSAMPYPYGGPWFPTPPPTWFASPPSQSMLSSSACFLSSAAKTNINTQHAQLNPEEWGVESRPRGGFVNLINAPSNHTNHRAEGSPTQPINIENGDVARTEKRLSWTNDEDLRLIGAWLNNSNDPIESNFKKNDKYWGDVAVAYNSTTPSSRVRHVKQVKDRFGKIRKKVGNFCCSWKEANSLYASGESHDDLMAKALKIYENDFKDGPFLFMHCWNELKNQPKWPAYLEQLDKSNKRKVDYSDAIPIDEEEDIPRPMGVKAAKAQRTGKGKSKIQACTTELEDDICKFMVAHAAAKEGQTEVLETQIRVSSDNLAAKKLARQTAMIETYRDLMNKDTRDMPNDVRAEFVHMLKCMREEIFLQN